TPRFVAWVDDFFAGYGGDPESQERMVGALGEIGAYWRDVLAERRAGAERSDDLLSYLLEARFDDRPLTDAELLDMFTVLTLAGVDTTRGELSFIIFHLSQHLKHLRVAMDTLE